MGHPDIQTTLIFADYSPSDREAKMLAMAFAPRTGVVFGRMGGEVPA